MKRLLFSILALVAMVGTVQAEVVKQVMIVDYFTSNRETAKYEDVVRNKVISGIQATQRLKVIDADGESSLKIEASRRTSESAIYDETSRVGEMKTLGANYILMGSVDNLTTERKKTEDGKKTFFNATLAFTLKIINVSDGTVHMSKTFTTTGGGALLNSGSTEEKAILGTTTLIDDRMKTMIDLNFPLTGVIAEMKESKKNKLISCYINLGSGHGVGNGQYVKVSQIKDIAGRKSTIEIGRMKVSEIVAEDLSECKVTKGGDVIYSAFTSGAELVIETIKAGGLMGALDAVTY